MDNARPPRVADELAWELVRDEWELLLAIGSGPTTAAAAARGVSAPDETVARRLALLERHGLVRRVGGDGWGLVPAFYERREGMSSYLRDLVFRRLSEGSAAPVAGRVASRLGGADDVAEILATAEEALYPAVVRAANRRETERSERFGVYFAAATDCALLRPADGDPLINDLLAVLRAAASQRSEAPNSRSSYLWIAEMRTDPEIAVEIGEIFDTFIEALPAARDEGAGALGFAIIPSGTATSTGVIHR